MFSSNKFVYPKVLEPLLPPIFLITRTDSIMFFKEVDH